MTRFDPNLYVGREQTLVKHVVLESYLEKLIYKVGRKGGTLNYIDGFAGPWQNKGEALQDTSPHIATRVLRSVRQGLTSRACPTLRVRALFIESDSARCRLLQESLANTREPDVEILNGEFENRIADAVAFAKKGDRPFHFTFIDPCGWTGFGMRAITPLLQVTPGEVLVNFMTNQINRFIEEDNPKLASQFADLFGDSDFRRAFAQLDGLDRQERMVDEYCARLRKAGNFTHAVSAIVLNPQDNRAHFHLVYGTRHNEGLKTFREIERSALGLQSRVRDTLQHEARKQQAPGQTFLFGQPQEMLAIPHVERIHARHLARARARIVELLAEHQRAKFDDLAVAAMQFPTVSEQDTREILMAMKEDIVFEGIATGKRTPQWNQGHWVRAKREIR